VTDTTDNPTRTARLNSIGILLARIANGITPDEAQLLTTHIDTEIRESTLAHATLARIHTCAQDALAGHGAEIGRFLLHLLDEQPGPAATKPGLVVTIEGSPTAACEAIRQMDADTTEPHTGLVVQPYRDHGEKRWVFRCWGTDTCDGYLSLDHYSQQAAERARDRHLVEDHTRYDQEQH
jgi:hypothetical protein